MKEWSTLKKLIWLFGSGTGGLGKVWKTVTGSIVSFVTSVAYPMRKLLAQIEPQQDLHGYDAPWAAGGGKNKLPFLTANIKTLNTTGTWSGNTYTLNGVTFTINEQNGVPVSVSVTGTATENIEFLVGDTPRVSGESYIVTGCPSGGSTSTYRQVVRVRQGPTSLQTFSETGSGVSVDATVQPDGNVIRVGVWIYSGYAISGTLTFQPMVRLSSVSDATFAPYSNECPISGWTGLSGERDGKNLFDTATAGNEWVTSGGYITTKGSAKSVRLDCKAGEVFTLSNKNTASATNILVIACFDANNTMLSREVVSSTTKSVTATVPNRASFLIACFNGWSLVEEAQLEVGSTATAYEAPVTSLPITCTWQSEAGTVYGGTVDVVTGVLTVDTAVETENGGNPYWQLNTGGVGRFYLPSLPSGLDTSRKAESICNVLTYKDDNTVYGSFFVYGGSGLYVNKISASETLEQFKTRISNPALQIIYPLAQPQTYQLTPQQIETLLGNNTVFVDCGSVSVTYQASIKGYIDKVLAS